MNKNKKVVIAKEKTFCGYLFRFFAFLVIEPLIRLIWVKKVVGKNNLPKKGAYLLTANHQSYFDWLTLYSVMSRHTTFLAAEKLFTSRLWRPFMEYTGQIKVDREAEDKSIPLGLGLEILADGQVLAIFPQGTRSRSGQIEKTFTGVARLALEARVPVVPVGIKGAYEVMAPSAKKPKFKKIVEIYFGQPMDLSQYYDALKTKELYREITNEIMTEVARLAGLEYIKE
jgi:1-acyl-sn-glycerol-3-phosphate acyltransferase